MTLVQINLTGFISLFLVLTFSPDRFERVLEPSIFSALLTLIKKVSLSTMENFSVQALNNFHQGQVVNHSQVLKQYTDNLLDIAGFLFFREMRCILLVSNK